MPRLLQLVWNGMNGLKGIEYLGDIRRIAQSGTGATLAPLHCIASLPCIIPLSKAVSFSPPIFPIKYISHTLT